MSEFAPSSSIETPQDGSERIHSKELAHLAALVVEAAMRGDAVEVAKAHTARTGLEAPNSYAPNKLRIGEGVVPEQDDAVYRHVTESGVADLAAAGIVRGARAAGRRSKTNGDTVYWNAGESGQSSTLGQGFVIEAPMEAAQSGWVTADKVSGVYTRDEDGRVKNLLPSDR